MQLIEIKKIDLSEYNKKYFDKEKFEIEILEDRLEFSSWGSGDGGSAGDGGNGCCNNEVCDCGGTNTGGNGGKGGDGGDNTQTIGGSN